MCLEVNGRKGFSMGMVYIMRGLPGAGKNYWIAKTFKIEKATVKIASADDFRINAEGKYVFSLEDKAHEKCLRYYVSLLQDGYETIVVNNTNVRKEDFAPYYRLAEAYGYQVELVFVIAQPQTCFERGTHNVPLLTIQNMQKAFDGVPIFWNQKMILNDTMS